MRIIVPYPVGGGIDVLGRQIGERLAARWNYPVVIENRPGGSTIPAVELAAKAAPDGHTLLLTTDSSMSINPHLFPKLPYDPVRDFAPITLLVLLQQLLVAHPALPAKSLSELVAIAKAKPGTINYGSYGSGSQPHLAGELLKAAAGINLVHVPYKGLPLAVAAVLAGEIELTFAGIASSRPLIEAARLRALAIGGTQRATQLPAVPTFAELGFPDVETHAWFGLFAPIGTVPEIVETLHRDIRRILEDSRFRDSEIVGKGYDLVGSTPTAFAAYLREDTVRRARAVRISGARAE